jgi:hypothetical protein
MRNHAVTIKEKPPFLSGVDFSERKPASAKRLEAGFLFLVHLMWV